MENFVVDSSEDLIPRLRQSSSESLWPDNCSLVPIIRTTFLNVHAFRQLITKRKFIFMNTCTQTGYESLLVFCDRSLP
jgi:hypothetical protein